jgi:uncharacterized membrane protein
VTRRDARALAACIGGFSILYALLGLFRHWQFKTNFDLAIFDQVIWHLSRFETPTSTVLGLPNILGDHFHPIIVLFAPLYWIWSTPETLIAAQAILFAASMGPVFLFLRDRLEPGPTIALTVAYGLFWGFERAILNDVHEFAFAPLILSTAILAMDRRRWGLLWTAAIALMLTKEDLVPVVAFIGLTLALQGHRRVGLALMVTGAAAFLLIIEVVIPAFGADSNYVGAYEALLRRPWDIPAALITPPAKLMTALLWLAPFVLLPLLSPIAILLVPFVFTRLLSDVPAYWGTTFHYSAPIAPILVMSAGDGLCRIARCLHDAAARRRVVAGFSAASIVLSLFLPGNQPHWNLFKPSHYAIDDRHRAGYAAIAQIPRDASVVAQGAILPHVTHRQNVFILRDPPQDALFVIANRNLGSYPLGGADEVDRVVSERKARGYEVIRDSDGWVLLRKRE